MSVVQLCVASVQNTHAVISGVHLGEKKKVADRLKNVKNQQCTKIRAKHGENLLLFKKVQIEREDSVFWKQESNQIVLWQL